MIKILENIDVWDDIINNVPGWCTLIGLVVFLGAQVVKQESRMMGVVPRTLPYVDKNVDGLFSPNECQDLVKHMGYNPRTMGVDLDRYSLPNFPVVTTNVYGAPVILLERRIGSEPTFSDWEKALESYRNE